MTPTEPQEPRGGREAESERGRPAKKTSSCERAHDHGTG
jgi:hypothetical protein